ncbi:pyridoxal phosphate-dependent aminotransferase [Limimaricola pyoseonensis]|uniref:Aminotransferase n=1 Tax=Limimaricola pyoseonensis TaxID=521013 RepID=A0A1G6ZUE3_9RHOB|nr:pyridoxal phosphate-dependent aminotransferase [Limimaricola pyoseonensis]SDE06404.1 arginine:pyruvate transaminase [Limimaricola pyoseonensis]
MTLSHRITHITAGGPDGWDLFRKARRMVAAGRPVIELTIGEHDIRTDPEILQAMDRAARGGHTGYAAVPGTPELRAEIARRLTERTGVPTGPENVLVVPGGQAGLFAAHHATCDEGDGALYIDPYYATYPGTVRAVGAVALPVAARAEDGFLPRTEDIEAEIAGFDGRVRSLLINTPNNPTGAVYPREALEALGALCAEHGLWLISDEVYDTQLWDGAHLSPRALPGLADRTLVVGSLSKSHAMTGSRVGWVAGPEDVIAAMENLATHTTYGIPGFVQDAGLHALQLGAEFEAKVAAPFRRRREIAARLVAEQEVVRALPMQGAMYAMLDIRATGLSGEAFADALLEQEGIAVMPGESFGRAAAGHVRVALTVEDDRFEEALSRLLRFAAAKSAGRAA